METALGPLVLYVVRAAVVFTISMLITRAIFRIDKIVDLLTSIDSRLQTLGISARATPAEPAHVAQNTPAGADRSSRGFFGIPVADIFVGEKFEKPGGQIVEVVDFERQGLKVRNSDGSLDILLPRNPNLPKTQWVFEVRSPS